MVFFDKKPAEISSFFVYNLLRVVNSNEVLSMFKSNFQILLLICGFTLTATAASANENQACDRSVQEFCLGDRVMSGSFKIGSVEQVFASGRLLVNFDRQMRAEILSPREVIRSVSCAGQICQGQIVTNFLNQRGQVIEVFANGWARIQLESPQSTVLRKVSEISLAR